MKWFIPTVLSVILIGCAAPRTPVSLPPIILDETATRQLKGLENDILHFPRGEYLAAFRDGQGVFYKPPTPIIRGKTPDADMYLFVGDKGQHGVYEDGAKVVIILLKKLPIR